MMDPDRTISALGPTNVSHKNNKDKEQAFKDRVQIFMSNLVQR